MKILFRILVILAAALLVIAALSAFVQSAYGQSLLAAGPAHNNFAREGGPPAGFADRLSGEGGGPREFGGRGERHGHGGQGFDLRGLPELGKNLAIVALCVAVVALGARLFQRDRPTESRPSRPGI